MAAVTICSDFGDQENKVCHCFHFFPIYLPWRNGIDVMILVFWMLSFKPDFHFPLSPSSRGSLVPLHFLLSVQFNSSVMSDYLRPHEVQHARPPCPSPSPGVHSDSRPLSRWCHPAISSSVIPFSSCPQSLPASGSFPMSQLFAWGGQSTGVAALASVLPKNT